MLLAGFRTYFTILPHMNPQTNDLYVCVYKKIKGKRLASLPASVDKLLHRYKPSFII